MPHESGGRRSARRVLNIQEDIAELGTMRRTTMLEIAPSKPTARSSYAEWTQSPDGSQEGARQSVGHQQRARRAPIWWASLERREWWRMVRKVTSQLRGHQGDSVSLSGSRQEISSFPRRIWYYARAQTLSDISRVVFVVWASSLGPAAHECIFSGCVTFCDAASQYIVHFRGTFYFKTACLLLDMVLDGLQQNILLNVVLSVLGLTYCERRDVWQKNA